MNSIKIIDHLLLLNLKIFARAKHYSIYNLVLKFKGLNLQKSWLQKVNKKELGYLRFINVGL